MGLANSEDTRLTRTDFRHILVFQLWCESIETDEGVFVEEELSVRLRDGELDIFLKNLTLLQSDVSSEYTPIPFTQVPTNRSDGSIVPREPKLMGAESSFVESKVSRKETDDGSFGNNSFAAFF